MEKPDLETAKAYLASEQYLWNSGMFIWKTSSILHALERFTPDTREGLRAIAAAIGTAEEDRVLRERFMGFKSESIDYAVMEKADNIYSLAGSFGWDDVGSWLALQRIRKTNEFENVVSGRVVTVDTENCIIQGGERLIAAVGLEDLIVIDADDALLVCEKNHAGDIKKVLENLRLCNYTQYL